jgi:hypothetical protein
MRSRYGGTGRIRAVMHVMKQPARLAMPILAAILWCGAETAAGAELRWEVIENTCPGGVPAFAPYDCTLTQRLKVPGGWLVRSSRINRDPALLALPPGIPPGGSYTTAGGMGVGMGLTCMPDAGHAWQP